MVSRADNPRTSGDYGSHHADAEALSSHLPYTTIKLASIGSLSTTRSTNYLRPVAPDGSPSIRIPALSGVKHRSAVTIHGASIASVPSSHNPAVDDATPSGTLHADASSAIDGRSHQPDYGSTAAAAYAAAEVRLECSSSGDHSTNCYHHRECPGFSVSYEPYRGNELQRRTRTHPGNHAASCAARFQRGAMDCL